MTANEDRIMPVAPVRSLRVAAIRPFGYEQPPQERKKEAKKRKNADIKQDYGGIITAEKVDYKV